MAYMYMIEIDSLHSIKRWRKKFFIMN